MNYNTNLSLLNSIQNVKPVCESLENIDEWQNKFNDEILTILHLNIRSVRLNWDLLLIKIKDVLGKLDMLILTEVNIKEEEALWLTN